MNMIKIMKFKYISVLFSLFLVSLLVTCKEEKGIKFGKDWKNGPDEELLEGNIYFVRHYKNVISEQLFDKYNVDPKEVAKLVVVQYAKNLVKIFEKKDYENFVWEISHEINEPLAAKLKVENNTGAVQNAWLKSLQIGKAYCSAEHLFKDPIKKIEIRAYEATIPLDRTDNTLTYRFTYRIDFIHTLESTEETKVESRSNAITIHISTNFVKKPTIRITRFINHCPVPELMDEPDIWH
ncbi:hypothetical protein [Leptospira sp. 'Mane']|uniref:hypothetical protein n=1 Tax=Leptospira sp. 'Mane' TaxID=3387407 RepID=UPI00398B5CCA